MRAQNCAAYDVEQVVKVTQFGTSHYAMGSRATQQSSSWRWLSWRWPSWRGAAAGPGGLWLELLGLSRRAFLTTCATWCLVSVQQFHIGLLPVTSAGDGLCQERREDVWKAGCATGSGLGVTLPESSEIACANCLPGIHLSRHGFLKRRHARVAMVGLVVVSRDRAHGGEARLRLPGWCCCS